MATIDKRNDKCQYKECTRCRYKNTCRLEQSLIGQDLEDLLTCMTLSKILNSFYKTKSEDAAGAKDLANDTDCGKSDCKSKSHTDTIKNRWNHRIL